MDEDYTIESKTGRPQIWLWLSIVILVVALVFVAVYFTKVYQARSSDSSPVQFTIRNGESATQIGQDLAAQKIIGSSFVFSVYAQLNQAGGKIQAGDYQLNRNMSIAEIMDVITQGRVIPSDRSVTIIEGWTNKQIGQRLNDPDFESMLRSSNFDFKFTTQAKVFDYQGFLFPDTYKLSKTEGGKELAVKMLKNFETKLAGQSLTGEQLIIASIIEKEVGRNTSILSQTDLQTMQRERELVASVFYNRLRIGMALESDATVNYITGKTDRSVSIADTKIKSPYNTYQVRGLPPSPISNPGLGSIMAAIYPAKSDYLFFLNKISGEAVFAKTLAEHNANKAKYLR